MLALYLVALLPLRIFEEFYFRYVYAILPFCSFHVMQILSVCSVSMGYGIILWLL